MTPEEIQNLRHMLCVSQEKFAQLIGTTVVTINRWENGKTRPSRLYIKELKKLKINTLHGWVKAMGNKALTEDAPTSGGSVEKKPYHWSSAERLGAIVDTGRLSSEEIGEYCRKKGIFTHHLEQWKAEFLKPKINWLCLMRRFLSLS